MLILGLKEFKASLVTRLHPPVPNRPSGKIHVSLYLKIPFEDDSPGAQ